MSPLRVEEIKLIRKAKFCSSESFRNISIVPFPVSAKYFDSDRMDSVVGWSDGIGEYVSLTF